MTLHSIRIRCDKNKKMKHVNNINDHLVLNIESKFYVFLFLSLPTSI